MSTMKFGQLYKTVLMLCGLVLLVCGITCVVIGILLEHDDMNVTAESRSRTTGSQYWLGLPLMAYGALMIVLSLSHRRRQMLIFASLFLSIPMIAALFVGSVLHGSSYGYFLSRQRQRAILVERGYACIDIGEDPQHCQCIKPFSNSRRYSYPCGGGPYELFVYHGAIFCFAAIAMGIMLGVFTFNIVFLLHTSYFKPPAYSDSLENRGFSHQSHNNTYTIIRSTNFTQNSPLPDGPVTQPDSQGGRTQTELETPTRPSQDQTHQPFSEAPTPAAPSPCYESLVSGFTMTAIPNTSRNLPSALPRNTAEIKNCATVHHRGEVYSDSLQSSKQPPKPRSTFQDISSSRVVTRQPGVTSERRVEVTSNGAAHSRAATEAGVAHDDYVDIPLN